MLSKTIFQVKEVWRIFSTKTILFERHNGSFSNVRWFVFFKLIIIKAIQTHSRKNKQRSRQTKTNKLRRDFFPVAEVYSRIENSWKEPHQFLHIPGIDPDSRA